MNSDQKHHFIRKRIAAALAFLTLAGLAWTSRADEHFDVLQSGSEVYSNVTVTTVTATDIYFSHARGMGNAKLKNLNPELQKHFHFQPAKARELEKAQLQATAHFREDLARRIAAAPKQVDPDESANTKDDGDIVVSKLYAKSFRGGYPPAIIVEQWLTPPPDPKGKFVLVDFWATWCEPCRNSIPHLNELAARFKDRLIVVGLSNEPLEKLRSMTSPHIDYPVGTDVQARSLKEVGVEGIPHALLMDPKGIVRFEGIPTYLSGDALARLIDKYSE